MINCQEAGRYISGYVNDTLSLEELDQFLTHVRSCPECMEELETYYIVYAALQQLDGEDSGNTLDMQHLLEVDMRKKEKRVRRKRIAHFLWMLFLFLLCVLAAAFLIFVGVTVWKVI